MDYAASFKVSEAGMRIEKMRLDATALNIANMNTSRSQVGGLYKPLRVIAKSTSATPSADFDTALSQAAGIAGLQGAPEARIVAMDVAPRQIHDPGNPDADQQGNVAYPGVNHLNEMVTMVAAVRAYEANVVAMNATKLMASKALDIGGNS
jgi:flagellar basal-body rod protein FlgC